MMPDFSSSFSGHNFFTHWVKKFQVNQEAETSVAMRVSEALEIREFHGFRYKVKHRADFGISVLKEYWGLGLGKALTKACIQCAKNAGYNQLELNVVADNERALSLYRSLGFEEFGRNPRGFNSKTSGYQELIYMMLKL